MLKTTKSALERIFRGRVVAYNRIFDKKSPFAQAVLMDLAKFCRAHESTYHPDPRIHAQLEGRREVWLRIQGYLQLDLEELYQLHAVKNIERGES